MVPTADEVVAVSADAMTPMPSNDGAAATNFSRAAKFRAAVSTPGRLAERSGLTVRAIKKHRIVR
jgi:hypothetical protein